MVPTSPERHSSVTSSWEKPTVGGQELGREADSKLAPSGEFVCSCGLLAFAPVETERNELRQSVMPIQNFILSLCRDAERTWRFTGEGHVNSFESGK